MLLTYLRFLIPFSPSFVYSTFLHIPIHRVAYYFVASKALIWLTVDPAKYRLSGCAIVSIPLVDPITYILPGGLA